MFRRTVLLPTLLVAGLVMAACGSSTPSASNSTTTTGASAASCQGTAGQPAVQTATLPAVAHATDLAVEPVISAGTPPPPTTLVTRDLVVGRCATATASSTVLVQYVGTDYTDGTVFDSSWSRGAPTSFPLSGVVPGFAQGIEGMKVGGRREIVIPPALGYGASGQPPAVGANETLVFVVDLKSVS